MRKTLKVFGIAAAALACSAALAAPAYAGGGHGRGHGYDRDYRYDGWRYDGHRGYWRDGGRHHYRYYRKHRGGLSGAEAGLIAAGIVGAAILIDSANDRRYDDRYYGRYDDRYDDRGRYYDRGYYRRDRYYGDDFYYRRDGGEISDRDWDDLYDDDLDSRLAGAGAYNYGAAYNDCKAEARDAARNRGLVVGLPARPERIQPIDGGAAVRFVTSFTADGRRQTMVCEADSGGVRFLELA